MNRLNHMKTTCLLILLLMAGSVLAANETRVASLNPTNPVTAGGIETFEAKVLKAYVVNEGNAAFRAYVVLRKGQEVVAIDLRAESSYREGDTVKVMVMRIPGRNKISDHESLNFCVMPDRSSRSDKGVPAQKLAGGSARFTVSQFKEPVYIDCQSNSVTLYPGSTNVIWEALQFPDNAVERLLDQIQASNKTKYVIVMARPDSVKVFRQVRKMVAERTIDASYDVVDAGFKVDWDERIKSNVAPAAVQKPGAQIAPPPSTATSTPIIHPPPPMAHIVKASNGSEKQPMFFECRNDQVFYVDTVGLDEKIAKVLSLLTPGTKSSDPSGFVKAINDNEIGNENYKVSPSYLLAMIMALEPKPGVRGDNQDALPDSNSNFQKWLRKLNLNSNDLIFLVRDDSFKVFRQAREIAEKIGFDVSWELLDKDEPIKFGTGGQMVPAH